MFTSLGNSFFDGEMLSGAKNLTLMMSFGLKRGLLAQTRSSHGRCANLMSLPLEYRRRNAQKKRPKRQCLSRQEML
jgi:hypothetical protein